MVGNDAEVLKLIERHAKWADRARHWKRFPWNDGLADFCEREAAATQRMIEKLDPLPEDDDGGTVPQ